MEAPFLIRNVSWFRYMLDFADYKNASVDRFLASQPDNHLILGAYDHSGCGKGLLICTETEVVTVNFLRAYEGDYTIRYMLLDACIAYAKEKGKQVTLVCVRPFGREVFSDEDLAEPLGLTMTEQYYFFVSHLDASTVDFIKKYNERLQPIIARWNKRGFFLKSFEQLSEADIRYILEDPDGIFDDSLDSNASMRSSEFDFAPELSFAVMKDDKVCAYSIFGKQAGKICHYRIRQASSKYRALGLSSYCTQASIDAAIELGYKRIQGMVYSDNAKGLPLFMNSLRPGIQSVAEYKHYVS